MLYIIHHSNHSNYIYSITLITLITLNYYSNLIKTLEASVTYAKRG